MSWHLRKLVEVTACPVVWRLRHFPASQEDKYRDKINLSSFGVQIFAKCLKGDTHKVPIALCRGKIGAKIR